MFVLICFAGTFLLVPLPVLYLAAGALFGLSMGLALVSAAVVSSAGVLFLAGRYLSRKWVIKKIALHRKVKAVDDAVGNFGWKMVFLLRLTVVLPFSVMNYGLGLSKIPFSHYLLSTWTGMMPGMLLYVYLGSLAGEMVFEAGPPQKTAAEWLFFGIGLLVTLGLAAYATLFVRKVLK